MKFHPDTESDSRVLAKRKILPDARTENCIVSGGRTARGEALCSLGQLLDYPQEDFAERTEFLTEQVTQQYPATKKLLTQFVQGCHRKTQGELEELYTRTFDLAAICSPYITGYIYGDENFDRGTFMALLGEKFQEMGFDTRGELPDHLAVLLRFSAALDSETLDELISFCLLDPINQMEERLQDADNPYTHLLAAISLVIKDNRKVDSKRD